MLNKESNLNKIAKKMYLNDDSVGINADFATVFNDKDTVLTEKMYRNMDNENYDVVIYNVLSPINEVKLLFNKYALENKILRYQNRIFIFTNNDLSYYRKSDMQKALLFSLDCGMEDEDKAKINCENARFHFLDKTKQKTEIVSQYFLKSRMNSINLSCLADRKSNDSIFWVNEELYSELIVDSNEYEQNDGFRCFVQTEAVCLTPMQNGYFKKKGFQSLKKTDIDNIDFSLIDLFLSLKNKKFRTFFSFNCEHFHEDDGSLFSFLLTTKDNKLISDKMIEKYEKIIVKKYGKDYQKRYEKMRKILEKSRISDIRLKKCDVLSDLGVVEIEN